MLLVTIATKIRQPPQNSLLQKFYMFLQHSEVTIILTFMTYIWNVLYQFRSRLGHRPARHCTQFSSVLSGDWWNRIGQLICDGIRAETRFRLSTKRTSPFKSAGASVQSTTDSGGMRISGSSAGYTMFRGSVKGTGYPLHSPVSPSPCVTVCHHISTGLYPLLMKWVGRGELPEPFGTPEKDNLLP